MKPITGGLEIYRHPATGVVVYRFLCTGPMKELNGNVYGVFKPTTLIIKEPNTFVEAELLP